jgi:hypothetical protein
MAGAWLMIALAALPSSSPFCIHHVDYVAAQGQLGHQHSEGVTRCP